MTREELERRLDEAEKQNLGLLDEIKNLKAKLVEQDDDKEIPEYPEFDYGDTLYAADVDCSAATKIRHMEITAKVSHKVYDVFHDDLYAQEYADKCKLIAMMLHCKWYLDRDYHPDFNNIWAEKWTVNFNYNEGKFVVVLSKMREWSTIYFSTEENAQKCANWLNAHWKESSDE